MSEQIVAPAAQFVARVDGHDFASDSQQTLHAEADLGGADPLFGSNEGGWFVSNVDEALLDVLVSGHRLL